MREIDLNCDLGEGMGVDEALMPLITSANVACGGHAGNAQTMRATVKLAGQYGVTIGAHPGFEDRAHFGRLEQTMPLTELRAMVIRQIGRLREIADVRHVKPHGALYNLAARNRDVANAIAAAVRDVDPSMTMFALAGSELVRAAQKHGLPAAQEVFADRTYQPNGSLTPREHRGATIETEGEMADQVMRMIDFGLVRATDGSEVPIVADTVCLHGDGAKAVSFARALRRILEERGVAVRAFRPR
jgi:UPF0271 protein